MASGFPDNNFHTKNIREFIAKIKGGTKELDIVLHSNQALFKLAGLQEGRAKRAGTPG